MKMQKFNFELKTFIIFIQASLNDYDCHYKSLIRVKLLIREKVHLVANDRGLTLRGNVGEFEYLRNENSY